MAESVINWDDDPFNADHGMQYAARTWTWQVDWQLSQDFIDRIHGLAMDSIKVTGGVNLMGKLGTVV